MKLLVLALCPLLLASCGFSACDHLKLRSTCEGTSPSFDCDVDLNDEDTPSWFEGVDEADTDGDCVSDAAPTRRGQWAIVTPEHLIVASAQYEGHVQRAEFLVVSPSGSDVAEPPQIDRVQGSWWSNVYLRLALDGYAEDPVVPEVDVAVPIEDLDEVAVYVIVYDSDGVEADCWRMGAASTVVEGRECEDFGPLDIPEAPDTGLDSGL